MKKNLLVKYFLITALAVTIVFAASVAITYFTEYDNVKTQIVAQTEALGALVTKDNVGELDALKGEKSLRVTVIEADGSVLYESDTQDKLGDHLSRPEVQAAINGKPAVESRYSETLKRKMIYYALKTDDGLIVRTAAESAEISMYLLKMLPFALLSLIVALVVAYLIARKVSGSFNEKIVAVQDGLKAINRGKYVPIKAEMKDDGFYPIMTEINELFEKTADHIGKIQSEQLKLSLVLDNISQGILALNANGETAIINRSARALFRAPEDSVGKKPVFSIDDKTLCDYIDRIVQSGLSGEFEHTYGAKILSVNALKTEDELLKNDIAYIIIFTDITAEKLMIKQKSDFFANASHELKTPLTSMQGLSEIMLSRVADDDPNRKHLERIYKESVRLNELICDMLKLSNFERGETDQVRTDIDLASVCREIIAEYASEAEKLNIMTYLNGDATLRAEEKHVYELISNIYGNAVRYNKYGGKVKIQLKQLPDSIVMTISDTGIGIAQEHLPRVCERFYRVDKGRSQKTGGTGLGLSIVKHICAVYRAELNIESELGEGTTVTVRFPKQ